jgi:hypothetical protein
MSPIIYGLRFLIRPSAWQLLENSQGINALFLYANEDKNVVRFIRVYYEDLLDLGESFDSTSLILLIEKPPYLIKETELQSYWMQFDLGRYQISEELLQVIPYERSTVYNIANIFQIPKPSVPCLVLFRSIHERDLLVFNLNQSVWLEERGRAPDIITEVLTSAFRWKGKMEERWFKRYLTMTERYRPRYIELAKPIEDAIREVRSMLGYNGPTPNMEGHE